MNAEITREPIIDERWDEFLSKQPTGHHVQSSAWGKLKATGGMKLCRVIVKENDEIVGGAQILARKLPVHWSIGYITRGPVVKNNRADIMEFLLNTIEELAKKDHLMILSIELPATDETFIGQLSRRKFANSDFYIIPPTTVLTDVEGEDDALFEQMKSRTRRNVRKGLKSGLDIREGTEADIPVVYSWMEETAKYDPTYYYYDPDYYQKALNILGNQNMLKLFIAEYEGTPVSAIYVAALGDWAVFKWGASSGEHLDKRPNELLHWHAMHWSKANGCKFYDLGGITPAVAEALENGEDLPDSKLSGIAHFKLGFGEKFVFPEAYDKNYVFLPNWLVRWGVKQVWNNEVLRSIIRKVLNPG